MKLLIVIALIGLLTISANAQPGNKYAAPNWQMLDIKTDSVFGASVSKAYAELLKGKRAHRVIVAVIDGGLDTAHEDLAGHIWTNKKEIPGNNKDDDHNGFIDDVHGWNFLGGSDGKYIEEENKEEDREYYKLRPVFANIKDSNGLTAIQKKQYRYFLQLQKTRITDSVENAGNIAEVGPELAIFDTAATVWRAVLKKDSISAADMQAATAPDAAADSLRSYVVHFYQSFRVPLGIPFKQVMENEKAFYDKARKSLDKLMIDPNAQRRNIIGDDPESMQNIHYGNNNVNLDFSGHGTHVAGIIAAIRHNDKGMDGITDSVLIMSVRAAPDGDERDKDVALAIRYAVDNGARIINMSFGKLYSPQKKWVDEAIAYADKHNVLIVHAAGNNGKNLDSVTFYPTSVYAATGTKAPNFIQVGASTGGPDSLLAASFSNYSHTLVDLFAPGRSIYSTMPGNKYMFRSGTSMAAPVVAGIAALLLEYYPSLSARQLKVILQRSVVPYPSLSVYTPGAKTKQPFAALSATGGIVNAYKALQLAASFK